MQDKQSELDLFNTPLDGEYHLMEEEFLNRINKEILNFLPHLSKQDDMLSVLECGCGTGQFAKFFLKNQYAWDVTGVDIAPRMVEWNNEHKVDCYSSLCGDIENKELFAPKFFDIVLFPFVLHHFPDCSKVIENASYWVKDNGIIILCEPNGSSPVSKISKSIRHILEKVFGTETTVKKWKLATVNETDHSMKKYRELLNQNRFSLLNVETLNLKAKYNLKDFIDIRNILYFICNIFPQPIKGNTILIIAKKN